MSTAIRPLDPKATFLAEHVASLIDLYDYSLFANDMQRFSGNTFATGCCSLMGVSQLTESLNFNVTEN